MFKSSHGTDSTALQWGSERRGPRDSRRISCYERSLDAIRRSDPGSRHTCGPSRSSILVSGTVALPFRSNACRWRVGIRIAVCRAERHIPTSTSDEPYYTNPCGLIAKWDWNLRTRLTAHRHGSRRTPTRQHWSSRSPGIPAMSTRLVCRYEGQHRRGARAVCARPPRFRRTPPRPDGATRTFFRTTPCPFSPSQSEHATSLPILAHDRDIVLDARPEDTNARTPGEIKCRTVRTCHRSREQDRRLYNRIHRRVQRYVRLGSGQRRSELVSVAIAPCLQGYGWFDRSPVNSTAGTTTQESGSRRSCSDIFAKLQTVHRQAPERLLAVSARSSVPLWYSMLLPELVNVLLEDHVRLGMPRRRWSRSRRQQKRAWPGQTTFGIPG